MPNTSDSNVIVPMEESMMLESLDFEPDGSIPAVHTCDGEHKPPTLTLDGVPDEAQSIALIMEDRDIPASVKKKIGTDSFVHWILFDMPPETVRIPDVSGFALGSEGKNSAGENGYTGPCPPDGEHRYVFTAYALDEELSLAEGATKEELLAAMKGHILATAKLVGLYDRTR